MPTLHLPILSSPGGQHVYRLVDLFQRIYRTYPDVSAMVGHQFLSTLQDIVDTFSEIDDIVVEETGDEQFDELNEMQDRVSDLIHDLCGPYPECWLKIKILQAFQDYFDEEMFIGDEDDEEGESGVERYEDGSDTGSECGSDISTGSDHTVCPDETDDNPYELRSILAANNAEVDTMFS